MSRQKSFLIHAKTGLIAIGFTLLAAVPPSLQAAGFVLTGEVAIGGDKLAEVSGGSGDLKAGQLLTVGVGYEFDLNAAKTLRLRTGINYKFDSVNASNGDADFDRWPLDFLLVSRQGNWSLGGGLTYHLSPTFKTTVSGGSHVDFNDSLGFLLQAGYMVSERIELGGRITLIEYKSDQPLLLPSGEVTSKVDGNSIGLYVSTGF